jgi:hypoxanthine-DNA glycosylase
MAEIVKNRVIRPSSRDEKSKSYKIDTKAVSAKDELIVNISHESKSFEKSFRFAGIDVANKKSISFRVYDFGNSIDITWSGTVPIKTEKNNIKEKMKKSFEKGDSAVIPNTEHGKSSFDPISDSNSKILILGTMPGDKSIELNEYYAHSGNRFWKIIAEITENDIPRNYDDKKKLLLKSQIAIWDVVYKAERKGSLDIEIKKEVPNNLNKFIKEHKKLKIIVFNGKKSETLFNKYFKRETDIKYISLPSTSPANTRLSYDKLCKIWSEIIK